MRNRKPNLFLIGAMKSGTTYLRGLLNSHPSVFMCEPDEPSYFVDPQQLKAIWPDMWRRGIWRSKEHYLRLFQPAGEATIIGEASTNYSKRPFVSGVPEAIHAFNPDARIVYLLRDPVERAISHYWHMVRHHAEYRPMAQAIVRDSQFVAVSHYAMQVRPYLEHFGHDRVAVLTLERLTDDPAGTMRALSGWLGIDTAGVDPSRFPRPQNVTPEVISVPLWGGIPRQVRQSPIFEGIMPRVPPALQTTLHWLTNRHVHRRSVDVTGVVGFLRPIQHRQTAELTALLGRTFPEWTTLGGEAAPPALNDARASG